ncbi:MAG: hypothetical protein MMC33_010702, partial [Icmadophila ericetorum]|nr:hypothetical protein [Icmadophila ericetorum]
MDTPRIVLLVFLLIFLYTTPDNQRTTPAQQLELQYLIQEERLALDLLNTTHYGDLNAEENKWINVTGLREGDGYAWDLLPEVQEKAREQSERVERYWDGINKSGFGATTVGKEEKAPANVTTLQSNNVIVPFYQNVTGILRGEWVRSKIGSGRQAPELNLTALAPRVSYTSREYNRNITGHTGGLRVKLDEKNSEALWVDEDKVRELRAELTIEDETSSGDGWEIAMHGVHYPKSGSILLTTSGDKFAGIFSLPHFATSEHTFSLAQRLLNKTLATSVHKQEISILNSPSYPWSSSPNSPSESLFPTPHCEYVVYLQQSIPDFPSRSADKISKFLSGLYELEDELRFPTGASLGDVPEIKMTAVIFSPDCGFVLESKGPPEFAIREGSHLTGPKIEHYLRLVKRCILAFALITISLLFLLLRQMKESSTPSTRSRVSFYTIGMMAMGDGFFCMGLMVVSMFVDTAFLALIATTFLTFLCVSFFGMKFLMGIWTVQAPERRETERRNGSAQPTTAPGSQPITTAGSNPPAVATQTPVVITTAGADTLPLPVTARRPADTGATPIILPPDQDLGAAEADDAAAAQQNPQTTIGTARREIGALYTRFYFCLLAILFLSLHVTTWPSSLRSAYMNLLAFVYLSFWIPQIHRNVIRNCRKALRWEFIIGQSALRLIPFMYFYMVHDNILFVKTDVYGAYFLIGWVWIQVWALASQDILGSRFFVPNGWAPPAYDYHPIIREDDEEAGVSIHGFTQATTEASSPTVTSEGSRSKPRKVFDCAICMQNIDVPLVASNSEAEKSLGATIFARRAYM